MTQSVSLLDRIKAAMGTTYTVGYQSEGKSIGWVVSRVRCGGDVARLCKSEAEAEALALDLNARAVIDAIAGGLRWESNSDDSSACLLMNAYFGCVLLWDHVEMLDPTMRWKALPRGGPASFHPTEALAKSAVEAAFKAALMGEGK